MKNLKQSCCGFILSIVLILLSSACVHEKMEREDAVVLVFKHGKIAGDPSLFHKLIMRFEMENPGVKIKDEILPASTDEQHQFYVINLEGKSRDFDVISMDVIWVPEFARAEWLMDLSHMLPEAERDEFFSGPMEAVTYRGKVYAIPWYIDAGLLYYRKDLLDKYGFLPPVTWDELVSQASRIIKGEPDIYGFILQGKQYEGLVCNALEYMWGNGGDVIKEGNLVIDTTENRDALIFMRDLIHRYKVTPDFVTTAIEEPTRHIFGKGNAVFMRNWPYAWNIFNRPDSPVKGKVGVAPLPAFPGHKTASTLGGWQLGLNKFSRYPKEAERFIQFLTSYDAQKFMAMTVGYKPTRMALYKDDDLINAQPFIAALYDVFKYARPRPVTPYYMMLSQVMQPEFSAVLSGIKEPDAALQSAERQMKFILRAEEI